MNRFSMPASLSEGYLILPISMSRIPNAQDPQTCHEIIEFFKATYGIRRTEIIVLYTNSLYLNNSSLSAWEAKRRFTSQMLSHKKACERVIKRHGLFSLSRVHFMAWDEIILAAPDYASFYQALLRHARTNQGLARLLEQSINKEGLTAAQRSFLIEETVVAHILRQQRVALPTTIANKDTYRLLIYPGPYITIDLYQWQHRLLPQHKPQVFYASQYNFTEKVLYNFDEMETNSNSFESN